MGSMTLLLTTLMMMLFIVTELLILNFKFGKNFRTAPYYCKTNLFSQWQCIVLVIVFSIQELNA